MPALFLLLKFDNIFQENDSPFLSDCSCKDSTRLEDEGVMTEVLHFPSSSSPSPTSTINSTSSPSSSPSSLACAPPSILLPNGDPVYDESDGGGGEREEGGCSDGPVVVSRDREEEEGGGSSDHLSLLALLLAIFRRSLVVCKSADRKEICAMDISWPTDVRHVAHVTFDRFNGFLGLPVEFEPEVPRRAPSASATVFGVSTESMQLSFDSRGNSVPTVLLLMQRHLYGQGGLQAEGIFRINGENSQEEYVRDQLNKGVIPDGVDVHCLAGLIKGWFRELPSGVLDPLSPEEVIQCQTEEDCLRLVRFLPAAEGALLDWSVNLMADVAQLENLNKMNARNIAMVFAPNMTQMADPLTALMYAVQVMNFLKTLVLKTLREREDSMVEQSPRPDMEPFDENGHQCASLSCLEDACKGNCEIEQPCIAEEPVMEGPTDSGQKNEITGEEYHDPTDSVEKLTEDSDQSREAPTQVDTIISETDACGVSSLKASRVHDNTLKCMIGQTGSNLKRGRGKLDMQQSVLQKTGAVEKTKGIGNLSCINSRTDRIEAWR